MVSKDSGSEWDGVDQRREDKRKGERRKEDRIEEGNKWFMKRSKGDRRKKDRRKTLKERREHAVFSNLKKKLLMYFLLIVIVSLSISLELIWEVGEVKLTNGISEEIMAQAQEKGVISTVQNFDYTEIFKPLKRLQIRMLIVLTLVLISIFVTLYFFIKDVVGPLDEMVKTAKEISKGNLSKTVPVATKDEIGQLGIVINDITADFQEVLLMVGKISLTSSNATDIIHNRVEILNEKSITDDIRKELAVLYTNIAELKALVESFKFYQIDLHEL